MKYFGKIGFAVTEETSPGIWEEVITEKKYRGEIITLSKNQAESSEPNDSIKLSLEFSIVADLYANDNFVRIRYVTYKGIKWKITNVRPDNKRLILTTGGIYNG